MINDMVCYAIKNGSISQKDIMDNFSLNRAQSRDAMKKLMAIGAIHNEKIGISRLSVSEVQVKSIVNRRELFELNLDFDTNFEEGNILNHKRECLFKNCPAVVDVDDYGCVYIEVNGEKSKLEPMDGNSVRMALGGMNIGDVVSNKYYTYVYGKELVQELHYADKEDNAYDEDMIVFKDNHRSEGWGVRVTGHGSGICNGAEGYIIPAAFSGKGAVIDATNFPDVAGMILEEPLVSMSYLYATFAVKAPKEIKYIPDTVDNIEGMCMAQPMFEKCCRLPYGLVKANCAFAGCFSYQPEHAVPNNIKEYHDMFNSCILFNPSNLSLIPYHYDREELFGEESTLAKVDDMDILDDDTPLDDWINSLPEKMREIKGVK